MPLTIVPTESVTVNTEYIAAIKNYAPGIQNCHVHAMPTMRILMSAKRNVDLGPDGKVFYRFVTDAQDTYSMNMNQVFKFKSIDPISEMFFTTKQWYSSAGMNEFQAVRYGRKDRSMIDLAEENMQSIWQCVTERMNVELFSPWNESPETNGGVIDTYTILKAAGVRYPVRTAMRDMQSRDQGIFSLPMLTRKDVTHHTIGNISSQNDEGQVFVTDGGTAGNVTRATTGLNIDVVINDHADVCATFDEDVLEAHLAGLNIGADHTWLAPVPTSLYRVLTRSILSERRRTPQDDALSADLGIKKSITWDEYNVTFYVEPMMDVYYPNSVYFFDPNSAFLVFDPEFDPRIKVWDNIPGSNQQGTVVVYDGNFIRPDASGVSAMHGFQAP